MKTRLTKFITRKNCPETNSSSSHSFVFSKERLKDEDLLLSTQTIIPTIYSDGGEKGKTVAEFNGSVDSYELYTHLKRVNDSRSKALYAFGSARVIYGRDKGKKKLEEIKKVIKDTLNIDEVKLTHWSDIDIDHQSYNTLKIVLDEGYEAIKEFIFNPRVWLFLLWDSEDSYDNPIFDVCDDIFNFEVSMKIPILVEKFMDEPEIQEIEFTKLSRNYPDTRVLLDIYNDIIYENDLLYYSSEAKSMIKNSFNGSRKYFALSEERTEYDPKIYEFFGLVGLEEDLYVACVNSTIWNDILENIKKAAELPKDPVNPDKVQYKEQFLNDLNDINSWYRGNDENAKIKYIVKQIVGKYQLLLTESDLKTLGIKEEDIKLFKMTIYSRKSNEVF